MPTENFKSDEAYRKWSAYRHIHGIAAPNLKTVCIKGRCHDVKHSNTKKLGHRARRKASRAKHARRRKKR